MLKQFGVHESEHLIELLDLEVEQLVEELLGILLQLYVLGAYGYLDEQLQDELDHPDT